MDHNRRTNRIAQFSFQTGRVTGQRALVAAWLFWLVWFCLMPVSAVFYGTAYSVVLFVSANVALWLGMSLALYPTDKPSSGGSRLLYRDHDVSRILALLVVLSVAALAAKIVDLIQYRDILSATSFAEGRLKMGVNGSNLFSGIYFALSPVIMAAGVLAVVLLRSGKDKRIPIAALVLFGVNPAFSFVYGGRSVLVLASGLLVITWLLVVPKLSRRQLQYILAGVGVVFLVTMYLFVKRAIETVGVQVALLATKSDYTRLVPLDDRTIALMQGLPSFAKYFLYYVTSVGQYVIHGVFEFFYLVQVKDPHQPLLWGKYEFSVLGQVQRAILGPDAAPDLEVYNPTTGLFSTFWGPAYIDFGFLMVVFGLAIGYLTGRVGKLVERGDLFALPLYALLILQLFLVPVVNGLLMASALILDIGFFGIWLLARWRLTARAPTADATA